MNNRQNGRRRGRGGQQVRGGQPGSPNGGSRVDNRARGNAAQLLEKYKTLARDAQMQGDRVNTEYYLQFADHYFRVLSENRSRFEEQRPRQSDYRDEFGDEGDGEQQARGGYERADETGGDEEGGDGWDESPAPRARQREERPRREVEARAPREAEERRPRNEGAPRAEGERRRRAPVAAAPVGTDPIETAGSASTPAPERIELDRLPPSLGIEPAEPANDASEDTPPVAPKPRRRRRATTENAAAEA